MAEPTVELLCASLYKLSSFLLQLNHSTLNVCLNIAAPTNVDMHGIRVMVAEALSIMYKEVFFF